MGRPDARLETGGPTSRRTAPQTCLHATSGFEARRGASSGEGATRGPEEAGPLARAKGRPPMTPRSGQSLPMAHPGFVRAPYRDRVPQWRPGLFSAGVTRSCDWQVGTASANGRDSFTREGARHVRAKALSQGPIRTQDGRTFPVAHRTGFVRRTRRERLLTAGRFDAGPQSRGGRIRDTWDREEHRACSTAFPSWDSMRRSLGASGQHPDWRISKQ